MWTHKHTYLQDLKGLCNVKLTNTCEHIRAPTRPHAHTHTHTHTRAHTCSYIHTLTRTQTRKWRSTRKIATNMLMQNSTNISLFILFESPPQDGPKQWTSHLFRYLNFVRLKSEREAPFTGVDWGCSALKNCGLGNTQHI